MHATVTIIAHGSNTSSVVHWQSMSKASIIFVLAPTTAVEDAFCKKRYLAKLLAEGILVSTHGTLQTLRRQRVIMMTPKRHDARPWLLPLHVGGACASAVSRCRGCVLTASDAPKMHPRHLDRIPTGPEGTPDNVANDQCNHGANQSIDYRTAICFTTPPRAAPMSQLIADAWTQRYISSRRLRNRPLHSNIVGS